MNWVLIQETGLYALKIIRYASLACFFLFGLAGFGAVLEFFFGDIKEDIAGVLGLDVILVFFFACVFVLLSKI